MPLAFVQAAAANNDAASTSIAAPSQSHTTGNLIVVGVRSNAGVSVSSITDTTGNTYVRIAGAIAGQFNSPLDLWYAKNITGHASNVVTANFSGSVDYRGITVSEFSGADATAPLDASATGSTGEASSITSGTFTTAQADEVLVATVTPERLGVGYTPGTGYTIPSGATSDYITAQYKIVSSVQTGVTAGMSFGSIQGNAIVVGTFKAAMVSTFTATAAVTIGAATCSAGATFAPPVYSAAASVTVGAATCAGSAAATAPTYQAAAAVTVGAATCAGAAAVTNPTYTATASVTVGAATCAGSAVFATAVYEAAAAVTIGPATCAGGATFAAPVYTAAAAVTVGAATCSAAASHTPPNYTATLAVTVGAAIASAEASFAAGTKTAAAAVTIAAATCNGAASFISTAITSYPGRVEHERLGLSCTVEHVGFGRMIVERASA